MTGWTTPPTATFSKVAADVTPWMAELSRPPQPLLRPRYVLHTTWPDVYDLVPILQVAAQTAYSLPFHEPAYTSVLAPTVATVGCENTRFEH